MISVSEKKWEKQKVNKNLVEKVKQDYGFGNILSHLIISRNYDSSEIYGINNDQEIINIFKDDYDFQKASLILLDTIKKNEKVCILGDYDVDGSCATSLFVRYFNHINLQHFFYIPDRVSDGYGASKKLFQKLIIKKPKLIIMVDCGSNNIEAINYLNKNNIKSLVIDHHEIHKPYPKANVIINPKKDNGYSEYNYLCATSLTYFFLEILIKKTQCKINFKKYLIYVLMATVCDVMPLRKLNRLISITALKEFNINDNHVFEELYNLSNKNNKITINDLGYLIGPILNSGGRLGKSNYATELLSTNNPKIINKSIIINPFLKYKFLKKYLLFIDHI